METITSFLSVIFGSAGLSTLIVSLSKRARGSRSYRRLGELKKFENLLPTDSYERKVAEQAVATESLRIGVFALQQRSVLAKAGRAVVVFTVLAMMMLLLWVVYLEYLWSNNNEYEAAKLALAGFVVVFYSALAVLVFVVMER